MSVQLERSPASRPRLSTWATRLLVLSAIGLIASWLFWPAPSGSVLVPTSGPTPTPTPLTLTLTPVPRPTPVAAPAVERSAPAGSAQGINRFVYLRTAPARGARAEIALGSMSVVGDGLAAGDPEHPRPGGSDSAWISVGGSHSLDIIQVGAMTLVDGSRVFFAAWGRGEPGAPGSLYAERYLGPVDRSWHTYELRLSDSTWIFLIDGTARLQVNDSFRNWPLGNTTIAVEAEPPNTLLGGTVTEPTQIRAARVLVVGAYRIPPGVSPGDFSWQMGGYAIPAETSSTFGPDWLKVWRS